MFIYFGDIVIWFSTLPVPVDDSKCSSCNVKKVCIVTVPNVWCLWYKYSVLFCDIFVVLLHCVWVCDWSCVDVPASSLSLSLSPCPLSSSTDYTASDISCHPYTSPLLHTSLCHTFTAPTHLSLPLQLHFNNTHTYHLPSSILPFPTHLNPHHTPAS